MNWFSIFVKVAQEAAGGVKTMVTQNKSGVVFFNIFGNTFPIKDQLKALGFRFFQGQWGTKAEFIINDPAKQQQLTDLGVDLSPLNGIDPNAPQEPAQPADPTQQPSEVDNASPADKQLMEMKGGIQQAIEQAKKSGDSIAQQMLGYVDDVIDRLANQVDDAAAEDFVQKFLSFSSKFWNYSFGNQILIWIQKPNASKVAGASQWRDKFGRVVTNWDNPIHIIRPQEYLTSEGKRLKKNMTEEQWNRIKKDHTRLGFTGAKVYDMSDTEPISNWTDPQGHGPYEGSEEWKIDDNTPVEEMVPLIQAAWEWGSGLGIDMNTEDFADAGMGGYSAGGKVRVNSTFDGVNKFSTLVHELAHEILHTNDQENRNSMTRGEREIEAETAAYIVLDHYGFESKDSPRYLALWRAKGEDVRKRRESITKAVQTIIKGIDSRMQKILQDINTQAA